MANGTSQRNIDLANAVVAITGGGRGIGRGTASAFAAVGARVAIGDLDLEVAQVTAAELGGGAIALPLDVTDRTSVDGFVAQVEERLGPIDVYVNNAGIMPIGSLIEESDAVAELQFAVNVHGTLHGLKAVLPGMLERRRGHIVNVASSAGKLAVPGLATYCGTKHAVVGITEALHQELRDSPIGLSLIMPGGVNTELASGFKPFRGAKNVEPHEVATAIVAAVTDRRFEVFVPRRLGLMSRIAVLGPRVQEAAIRLVGGRESVEEVDHGARGAYTERIERGLTERDEAKGALHR